MPGYHACKHRRDLAEPRIHLHHRAFQHHNGSRIGRDDFLDQLILAVRQFHVLPVRAFGIKDLIVVQAADVNHHVRGFRGGDSALCQIRAAIGLRTAGK